MLHRNFIASVPDHFPPPHPTHSHTHTHIYAHIHTQKVGLVYVRLCLSTCLPDTFSGKLATATALILSQKCFVIMIGIQYIRYSLIPFILLP